MVCGALMWHRRLASLRRACVSGDLAAAKRAIVEGVWVNTKDPQGHTPLSIAVTHRHWDIALALLAAQADPNVFPPASTPLLELATESKRLDVIEAMLDAQCIPPTVGCTPLHLACKFGHTKIVEKLAAARVDVNRLDSFGQTPLQICLDVGVPAPTFELLLEAGADVNYDPFLLLQACIADPSDHSIAVAKVLIAGGANVNGVCDGLSPSLLNTTAWSDTETEVSVTPLNAACICEHNAIVRLLLTAGADANLTPQKGRTPLYEASLHGNADIVQLLLDAGAETDAGGSVAEETPLKAASRRGHVQVVKLLLEAQAKTEEQAKGTPSGRISIPHAQVVQFLLDNATHESSSAVYQQLLLQSACERGHIDVVRAMVATGMDLNMLFKDGMSPLGVASSKGHAELVKLLLTVHVDVDLKDRSGETALFHGVREGHAETVELLLEAKADPQCTTKDGRSLLSLCLKERPHDATILELLLTAGADPNRHYKDLGTTPLVFTSLRLRTHGAAIRTLLDGGATPQLLGTNPGVSMLSPLAALFLSLERDELHDDSDYALYEMAHLLASHGAVWTDDCEWLLRKRLAPMQTLHTIHACFEGWHTDTNHASHASPMDVPREVIARGEHAVRAYLSAMKASGAAGIVLRRKICVVGPSCWGKTSLVRSITSRAPSLVHMDDRTVGIDLFAWTFKDDVRKEMHQVTFWDFAGQDEYQAAHSLFFSRRTLFLVCVDVAAYTDALTKLENSGDREHATIEMDEFVATNITRWLRVIFARQPDVQFVLVLTKADAVHHDAPELERVETDVRQRIDKVRDTVRTEIKRVIRKLKAAEKPQATTTTELTRLQTLKVKASNLTPTDCVVVSCKTKKGVLKAQHDLRRVICASRHFSFCMPETYSRVLRAVVASRPPATEDAAVRVRATFVKLDAVYESLTTPSALPSLTKQTCVEILRILHDLGDVLWYEELHASPLLRKTLVLEPQLLIEFLRQVVNHHHAPGRIGDLLTHKMLRTLPFWSAIRDDEALLLALKTVLHHFQLAYPTRRAPMAWDSDLIVPCYWRRGRARERERDALIQPLALKYPAAIVSCHVRFEYELGTEPPETLFEHLAVTTYSTLCVRTVESHRRITFGSHDAAAFACHLWTRREPSSGLVVQIEAVASDRGDHSGWQIFQHACTAMETVLADYSGLLVTRSALNGSGTSVSLDDLVAHLATLSSHKEIRPSTHWLPPDLTWYSTKPWLSAVRALDTDTTSNTTTAACLPPLIPSEIQVIVDRIDAMDAKMVQLAKGGSRADYPTLWTLEYTTTSSTRPTKARRLVVRILSDVSGKCWHEPLELAVASKWLTKYGPWIQLGISVLANATAAAPLVGSVLEATFNLAAIELGKTLRTARPVHNLIAVADLHTNETMNTSQQSMRGCGLLPDETTQLLVELLTTRDPKFTALKISGLTKLERCVTSSGAFVWAHRSEINAAAAGSLVRCNELPTRR